MKYKARFVFYYCDEFDTTHANIYDILLEEVSFWKAFKKAKKIVKKEIKKYSFSDKLNFISISSSEEKTYILIGCKLLQISEEKKKSLQNTFCETGETFITISI